MNYIPVIHPSGHVQKSHMLKFIPDKFSPALGTIFQVNPLTVFSVSTL